MKKIVFLGIIFVLIITACGFFNTGPSEEELQATVAAALIRTQTSLGSSLVKTQTAEAKATLSLPAFTPSAPITLIASPTPNGNILNFPAGSFFFPSVLFWNYEEGQIWIMRPDGSDANLLLDHAGDASFSPDNSKIAIEWWDQANKGIWVMNIDGTGATTGATKVTDFGDSPRWSPDGAHLLFHYNEGDSGEPEHRFIWAVDLDGGNLHKLNNSVEGSFPNWSAVNNMIIFHGETNNGIWLMNPDGTGARMIDRRGAYPSWSPDGKKISYINLDDWCLWTMNVDGSDRQKISTDKAIQSMWFDNGSKIIYEGIEGDIWIVNTDGSDNHMINKGGRSPFISNDE